jgi:hypothetical protein
MVITVREYYNLNEKELIKSNSFITILNSLICYNRDTLFSTWQILERQLEQLNPEIDNDIYSALDTRAQFVFDMWMQFRGPENGLY